MTAAAARSLSDFDVMFERLIAWGYQGRTDHGGPDPEKATGSIYDMGRANRDGDADEIDGAAPVAPSLRLTEREWDNLDGYVRQLAEQHRESIRRYFYIVPRVFVHRPKVDYAVRLLCDMEQGNAAARDRLRGRV